MDKHNKTTISPLRYWGVQYRINERARLQARIKRTELSGQIINLALFYGIDPFDYSADKVYGVASKFNQYPDVSKKVLNPGIIRMLHEQL